MKTLEEVMREHPAKPVRLYHPEKKDWFGETKRYLYRIRDGQRRVDLLRRRVELVDGIDDPDEDLTRYRDELHQKLSQAEQDMKRVTVEVMDLIGQLPSVTQQMMMTSRYVDHKNWRETAAEMGMSVRAVQMLHGRALPKLKRLLGLEESDCDAAENDCDSHCDAEKDVSSIHTPDGVMLIVSEAGLDENAGEEVDTNG